MLIITLESRSNLLVYWILLKIQSELAMSGNFTIAYEMKLFNYQVSSVQDNNLRIYTVHGQIEFCCCVLVYEIILVPCILSMPRWSSG